MTPSSIKTCPWCKGSGIVERGGQEPVWESSLIEMTALKDRILAVLVGLVKMTGIAYDSENDEVGHCAVCGSVSYKEHARSCELRKAKELIAELKGVE